MENKITIAYSTQYDIDDFKNLNEFDSNLEYHEYKQKSVEVPAIIIIALPAIRWFSKGFFTKLGETLGETTGKVISSKLYPTLKKTISSTLLKTNIVNPTLKIILNSDKDPIVNLFLKSSTKTILENNLDKVKEIYIRTLNIISKEDSKIKEVSITLNDYDITDFFYITDDHKIYQTKC